MKVIGIETSGKTGSVGAAWEGGSRERPFPGGTSHGRDLAPALSALLSDLGWRIGDVDLLAVSLGPGSYTGLRIGTAFAKALAFSAGKPLVGVPSFEAMVRRAPGARGPVVPVLDAHWGQMYASVFVREEGKWARLMEDRVGPPGEVIDALPEGALFFGTGASVFGKALEGRGTVSPPGPWDRVSAAEVAEAGRERFLEGGPDDPDRLHPIYLRPSQAEAKRGNE